VLPLRLRSAHIDAPPGRSSLRITVEGANWRTRDSEIRDIDVPDSRRAGHASARLRLYRASTLAGAITDIHI
jgi:hypothetical protein